MHIYEIGPLHVCLATYMEYMYSRYTHICPFISTYMLCTYVVCVRFHTWNYAYLPELKENPQNLGQGVFY